LLRKITPSVKRSGYGAEVTFKKCDTL